MGMPVTDTAQPRGMRTGNVSAAPTPFVTVNGAASAGSKHLLGSSDALTEQVRIDFNLADAVKTLVIRPELGQGSHIFGALVTINPGDDVLAATRLIAGYPEAIYVSPGEALEISSSVAITSVYVIAVGAVGATAASVAGRIYVEGYANA